MFGTHVSWVAPDWDLWRTLYQLSNRAAAKMEPNYLISWTPAASLMKEAKTMSTPCSTPNKRSILSFSETAGRSVSVPGRLQPFLEPRLPPFSISPMTKSSPGAKFKDKKWSLKGRGGGQHPSPYTPLIRVRILLTTKIILSTKRRK